MEGIYALMPIVAGWILDILIADPAWLPHPVVLFGRLISFFEHKYNCGADRRRNGMIVAWGLTGGVFLLSWLLLRSLSSWPMMRMIVETVLIFYCLAGTTLRREVSGVFEALASSVEEGRKRVARIVGRDTSSLSAQEIRTAALETQAENLSDGVVAPLFWYALLGVPGMLAYKMINTLDSMIGYRNERYSEFGYAAAKTDDVANYIPARLTAWLIVLVAGKKGLAAFVKRYGNCHASPNSGWPEAALAGVLDCRFGGTHDYFGESVYKPYIGDNPRMLDDNDLKTTLFLCFKVELLAVLLTLFVRLITL